MTALLRICVAGWILCLVSCASALNLRNSRDYYAAGVTHSEAGNHQQAAVLHHRAVINARLGGAKPATMAITLYGYGRELALIGEFDVGLEHLSESLEVERSAEPVNRLEVMRTSSVLGRVLVDTGRFDEALVHLQRAYTLQAEVDSEASPWEHLYLAKDVLLAAEGSGLEAPIAAARAELDALLQMHGDLDQSRPVERFTPAAVEARLAADRSPDEFRTLAQR